MIQMLYFYRDHWSIKMELAQGKNKIGNFFDIQNEE